jgi:cyanoexosortase B
MLKLSLINRGILVLLALIYLPLMGHWYDGWLHKNIGIEHEYFSHGILGLPYASYLVWQRRQKWARLPDKSNFFGLIVIGIACLFYLTKVSDLINLSLPIILLGICLFYKGLEGLKLHTIPLILIFFATPNSLPYLIEPYAMPLQKLIAWMAGSLLQLMGFVLIIKDNQLYIDSKIVEVAPHCAGLKMLFTSLYISLIFLQLTGVIRHWKTSLLLVLFTVFLSVSANLIRNTLLTMFYGTDQSHNFESLHEGIGGDIYSGLTLIILFFIIKYTAKYKIKHHKLP